MDNNIYKLALDYNEVRINTIYGWMLVEYLLMRHRLNNNGF